MRSLDLRVRAPCLRTMLAQMRACAWQPVHARAVAVCPSTARVIPSPRIFHPLSSPPRIPSLPPRRWVCPQLAYIFTSELIGGILRSLLPLLMIIVGAQSAHDLTEQREALRTTLLELVDEELGWKDVEELAASSTPRHRGAGEPNTFPAHSDGATSTSGTAAIAAGGGAESTREALVAPAPAVPLRSKAWGVQWRATHSNSLNVTSMPHSPSITSFVGLPSSPSESKLDSPVQAPPAAPTIESGSTLPPPLHGTGAGGNVGEM